MLSTYLSHLSSATLEMAMVLQSNRSSSDNSTAEPIGSLAQIAFYLSYLSTSSAELRLCTKTASGCGWVHS